MLKFVGCYLVYSSHVYQVLLRRSLCLRGCQRWFHSWGSPLFCLLGFGLVAHPSCSMLWNIPSSHEYEVCVLWCMTGIFGLPVKPFSWRTSQDCYALLALKLRFRWAGGYSWAGDSHGNFFLPAPIHLKVSAYNPSSSLCPFSYFIDFLIW